MTNHKEFAWPPWVAIVMLGSTVWDKGSGYMGLRHDSWMCVCVSGSVWCTYTHTLVDGCGLCTHSHARMHVHIHPHLHTYQGMRIKVDHLKLNIHIINCKYIQRDPVCCFAMLTEPFINPSSKALGLHSLTNTGSTFSLSAGSICDF